MADFQDLLHDAEQLTAQIDKENASLPRLQRTLSQLVEVNKRKLAKTTNYMSSESNEINASILLAGKGIDAPRLTQHIDSLNIQPSTNNNTTNASTTTNNASTTSSASAADTFSPFDKFASMEQLRDLDLPAFLRAEREQALMSVVDETRKRTVHEIEDAFALSNELEWKRQKQRIMNELLGSFTADLSNTTTTTSSALNRTAVAASRSTMTDVETEFAKLVFAYNQRVIGAEQSSQQQSGGHPQQSGDNKFDLLGSCVGLAERLGDKNVEEAWRILHFMADVVPTSRTAEYMSGEEGRAALDRDAGGDMQAAFVRQARAYLEHSFRELIRATVHANLKQAKLGGQLGTLALVSGYLRLSQSEKYHQFSSGEEVFEADKQPLWPTVYLCLRCGDVEAARQVAVRARKDDIAAYLDEIVRSKAANGAALMSSANENKLKLEYKSIIRRGNDLYKRAVYCYLCKYSTDDESINDILDNVDDFLWFKLNVVQTPSITTTTSTTADSSSSSSAQLTFADFQTKLSQDYGEKYFIKNNRNPFIYLHVLLLTAQFELAIELLLKYESTVVHGVHMAVSLFERRLLNVAKSPSSTQLILVADDQSEQPKCFRRVNFACLVKMYTRKFEHADSREALEYYFFLRNLHTIQSPGSSSTTGTNVFSSPTSTTRITNYFAQFIAELALETRDFELLFGKLERNAAIRRHGAIDKFCSEAEAHTIIGLVAEEMENKGLLEEAVRLYDLSRDYQRVLELSNKLVSQVCTEVNVLNSSRERIKSMCMAIAVRYKTETTTSRAAAAVPKSVIGTFFLLTDLLTFFDFYHAENWDVAYDTLCKLQVLPQSSQGVELKVKDFIAFSEEIKRNFPDIILAAMTIISNLYARISRSSGKNSSFQNFGTALLSSNDERRIMLNDLKEHAKALIKFVGCIPYRLSGDINARLLQLEVMMN